jgi:hypothetical protein
MTTNAEASPANPRVFVQFCQPDRRYAPLAPIRLRYEAEGLGGDHPRAVEHSILWYTEGKGEEDLGVHFFERVIDRARLPPVAVTGSFATRLPASPLTYEGVIVKLRWCVRVRLFFGGSRDFVSEHEFTVGSIPPARLPTRGGS